MDRKLELEIKDIPVLDLLLNQFAYESAR